MAASTLSVTRPAPVRRAVIGAAVVVALALGILHLRGWSPSGAEAAAPAPAVAHVPPSPAVEDRFGVRFTSVVLTGAGGVLQLRYQVLDTSKSAALHEQGTFPYLSSGTTTLDTPAMAGHVHAKDTPPGQTGTILLTNTGHVVGRGGLVTIHIGHMTIAPVVVG